MRLKNMTISKNNVDKKMEARDGKSLAKEIKLAEKDPDVLEFDFLNDVLDTLKEKYNEETKNNPMSFNDWLRSKPDSYFQRLTYSGGGKVIDFLSYAKLKEPKIKKINLAQGDYSKLVSDLSDQDKLLIKDLLKRSGINVGGKD